MKAGNNYFKSSKKGRVLRDSCLILFFLVLSLVLILVIKGSQEVGGQVVVAVNGFEIGKYSLAVDGQYSLNDGSNILVIENGRAKMVDANCPDKLCVKEGWVKYTGQCITCLPNKLTVTVVGGDDSVEIII
jgi:hypothetical protein